MCQDKLVAEGLSPSKSGEVLSTITGALIVHALGDTANMTEPRRFAASARGSPGVYGPRGPGTKLLRRWPRVIDEAAGERGTAISV